MNFVFSNIFLITFCKIKPSNNGLNSHLSSLNKENKGFTLTAICLFVEKLPFMTESGGIFSCNFRY